eukprot:sb/3462386/
MCSECNQVFNTGRARSAHLCCKKRREEGTSKRSCLGFSMITIPINLECGISEAITGEQARIVDIISAIRDSTRGIKFYLIVAANLRKGVDEAIVRDTNYFASSHTPVLQDTLITLGPHITQIENKVAEYVRQGSGWIVEGVTEITIAISPYEPLYSSGSYIPLPAGLKRKNSLINIQNKDERCLAWCLAAFRTMTVLGDDWSKLKDKQRTSKYTEQMNNIDIAGITWPISPYQIPRFATQNNIRINVIGYDEEEKEFYPISMTKNEGAIMTVLQIAQEDRTHYVFIQNLNALLRPSNSRNANIIYCPRCFWHFSEKRLLTKHIESCQNFDPVRMEFPEENVIRFENYQKMIKAPAYIVADFECIIEGEERKHVPCGYAYQVVSDIVGFNEQKVEFYRGDGRIDVVQHFLAAIQEEYGNLYEICNADEDINMTAQDEQVFKAAVNCWLCDTPLEEDRVRDHCHQSGKFLGAAHNSCNLKRRKPKRQKFKLPVIFHNFKGYDSHLLIRQLAEEEEDTSKIYIIDLPPKEAFFNDLTEQELSNEDYEFVQTTMEKFELETLGDLHDHYVQTDVTLLADVFQSYRTLCIEHLSLEPINYLSLPALTYDAALKYTKIELELIKDPDMHQMIESGVRGGVSVISHRLASANNPGVDNYNPKQPETYLLYIDANNLYGWSMSQPLPVDGFTWVDIDDWSHTTIATMELVKGKGLILEVDLHFPHQLHDKFSDYPLAPSHTTITDEMLSPFSRLV